jgi:phage gpG-like protein
MTVTVTVTGHKELIRKLGGLGNAMRIVVRAVGELVRGVVAQYPGPVHHPIRWASRRQQRAYWAMRRERGLPLAYTRQFDPMSQRLGASWTVAMRGDTAVVGTKASYAKWVQAAKFQQGFHKDTGWITDVQAAERVARSGDVNRIAEQALRKELGG